MNALDQTHGERRKNPRSTMSTDQFQEFTMQSLEEGKKQFSAIDSRLDTMAGHMETMSRAMVENTELTKQTAELAQKTANDTAGLVRLAKFSEATAEVVTTGTRGASKVSKLLIPILIVGAIITALWHGETLRWKDILEVIAK
jgi:PBP1b-binding outer membrane lipoprotein LpoB